MSPDTAIEALTSGKRLQASYHGYSRTVEVHIVGKTGGGEDIMLVWQVSGGSLSGERTGWKALKLSEILSGEILIDASEAPRAGYSGASNAIARVTHRI